MKAIITDFCKGAGYMLQGIWAYYANRSLWLYGIVPMLISALIYTIFIATCLAFLKGWMFWICLLSILLIVPVTLSFLYETCCGIFFDFLVAKYEQKYCGNPDASPAEGHFLLLTWDSFKFSCGTILWVIVLFPISFIPVAGQILFIVLIGYRYGITYLLPVSYFHGMQVQTLKKVFGICNYRIAGFGIMVYIMLMIPFVTIFVLPGLVIGGVQLYNDKLKENN